MKLDEQDMAQLGKIISSLYHRIEAQGNRSREGSDLAMLAGCLYIVKLACGPRGGFEKYIQEYLPFTPRTARRLRKQGDKWLKDKLISDGLKAELARTKAREKAKEAEEKAEAKREWEKFAEENPHLTHLWPFRKS